MAAGVSFKYIGIMCQRKRAYVDMADARAAVVRISKRSGAQVHAYRCPYCELWHVGHAGKRKR